MRVFLTVLVLIFNLQSWTKAGDISDFEIEGMSIGDTLLRFYSEDEIKSKARPLLIGGKKYYQWNKIFKKDNNKTYENLVLFFRTDDKNYIIKNIEGRDYYTNNINECYDMQMVIGDEIAIIIENAKKKGPKKIKMSNFPDGNSYLTSLDFVLDDGSFIRIACLDFSNKDTNSRDRLSVAVGTKEYGNWFHSKDKK